MSNWKEVVVDLERILTAKDDALDIVNRKLSQHLIDQVEGLVRDAEKEGK